MLLVTALLGFTVFIGLFVLLGKDLHWQPRGIIMLISLILVSGAVGAFIAPMIGLLTRGFGPVILVLVSIALIIGLFLFIGKDLRWKIRGILLLVLLIPLSGIIGFFISLPIVGFGDRSVSVRLEEASRAAGFEVLVPQYLPADLEFSSAEVFPSQTEFSGVTLHFRDAGRELIILEDKIQSGMPRLDIRERGVRGKGIKRELITIQGQPAVLATQDDRNSFLSLDLEGVSVDIEALAISKNELIKVAESLEKQ